MVDAPPKMAKTKAKSTGRKAARKGAEPPDSTASLGGARKLGGETAAKSWGKLVDEHSRPWDAADDMDWREARMAEGLADLGAEIGRTPTDRERAAYLAGWLYAIDRRIGAAQEECECRPAVAKYNEPSTPPELARVLRTFLLETFDASPMTGRLDNGAAFEVGIGIYDSEMTVAVLSQSVWFRVRDSLNAAIRADLR